MGGCGKLLVLVSLGEFRGEKGERVWGERVREGRGEGFSHREVVDNLQNLIGGGAFLGGDSEALLDEGEEGGGRRDVGGELAGQN